MEPRESSGKHPPCTEVAMGTCSSADAENEKPVGRTRAEVRGVVMCDDDEYLDEQAKRKKI
jgi:hypothetical protein